GRGDVVFRTVAQACRTIDNAERLGDPSLERQPAYDDWAELGYVPPLVLIADGWHFECDHCGFEVDQDDDGKPVAIGRRVFCNENCAAIHVVRGAELFRRRDRLWSIVLERWPWARPRMISVGCPGSCDCFTSDRDNVFARLVFSGDRVGNNHYCLGCGQLTICNGDAEAWAAAAMRHGAEHGAKGVAK
ncbi:hypothetical protein KC887_08500, partial [Candidatus Kaiserbacteria bacterium]|nr:hypothetical protein [Candidatus Kaiserbacteria bacterium]